MQHPMRSYGIPGNLTEYLPDPDEPIGRWFTMPNTGNSRAVARTVADLCPGAPDVLIDPFCGAGCSGLAARHLGIRFVGVEIDPVLACVSAAKVLGEPTDGEALLGPVRADERLPVRCLRVVDGLQGADGAAGLSGGQFAEDLRKGPPAVHGSAVIHGDATESLVWQQAPLDDEEDVVVFTSPPFFDDWAGPRVPADLLAQAKAALADGDRSASGVGRRPGSRRGTHRPPGAAAPRDYADLLIGTLRAIRGAVRHATAIIEHEPGSATAERLTTVADRLAGEAGAEVVEILRTGTFSAGGPLSLLVCRF